MKIMNLRFEDKFHKRLAKEKKDLGCQNWEAYIKLLYELAGTKNK